MNEGVNILLLLPVILINAFNMHKRNKILHTYSVSNKTRKKGYLNTVIMTDKKFR